MNLPKTVRGIERETAARKSIFGILRRENRNMQGKYETTFERTEIGILCAGYGEVLPFLQRIDGCSVSEKAMLKFYLGRMAGMDIITLFSGVCKVNAAIAAQILIDTYGCGAIIDAGTAGGMNARLWLFDIVVSEETAYHDVDEDILTEFHPVVEVGLVPGLLVASCCSKAGSGADYVVPPCRVRQNGDRREVYCG